MMILVRPSAYNHASETKVVNGEEMWGKTIECGKCSLFTVTQKIQIKKCEKGNRRRMHFIVAAVVRALS